MTSAYLPAWAAPQAHAAVADLVAYTATLTPAELLGSLHCLNTNVAATAIQMGFVDKARQHDLRRHAAMGSLVTRILLDRLPGVTIAPATEPTHAHCQGFTAAILAAEARLVSSGGTT